VTRLENREKLRLGAEMGVHQAAVFIKEKMTTTGKHALNQRWSSSEDLWKDVKINQGQYALRAVEGKTEEDSVYGLIDEERKINPNSAKPPVLQALFEKAAGVDHEEARRIVAAIQDWKDADDDLTEGGSESKNYLDFKPPYRAKNAPITILQELLWIKGITPEIYAKLRPHLTLDASLVNINTASEPVLLSMGIHPALVTKILWFRAGADGKVGTPDDGGFSNLMEVPDVLGRYTFMNEEDSRELADLLTFGFSVNSSCFTAQVFAKLKLQTQSIRVTAVIDQSGGIKRWYEEFF